MKAKQWLRPKNLLLFFLKVVRELLVIPAALLEVYLFCFSSLFFFLILLLSLFLLLSSCGPIAVVKLVCTANAKNTGGYGFSSMEKASFSSFSSFHSKWNTTKKITPREYYLSGDPIAASYTGKGVRVAMLDTGLEDYFPFMSHNKVACRSVVPGVLCGDKGYQHGTRSASVLAGNVYYSVLSFRSTQEEADEGENGKTRVVRENDILASIFLEDYPRYLGMAPDAEVLMIRIFDTSHQSRPEYIVDGLNIAEEWGADVINLSFNTEDYWDERMAKRIKQIIAKDVVIVSSAGNGGPEFGTIEHPADLLGVIAVGSSHLHSCSPPLVCRKTVDFQKEKIPVPPPARFHSARLFSPFCSFSSQSSSTDTEKDGNSVSERDVQDHVCSVSLDSHLFSAPQYCCRESVSSFSSRGPTTQELPFGAGRAKPDLVALGEHVMGISYTEPTRSTSVPFASLLSQSIRSVKEPSRGGGIESNQRMTQKFLFSSLTANLTNSTATSTNATILSKPFDLRSWVAEESLGSSIASPIVSGVVAQCIEALRRTPLGEQEYEKKEEQFQRSESKLGFGIQEHELLEDERSAMLFAPFFSSHSSFSSPFQLHFSSSISAPQESHRSTIQKVNTRFPHISVTTIKAILTSSTTLLSPTEMEVRREEDMVKSMAEEDEEMEARSTGNHPNERASLGNTTKKAHAHVHSDAEPNYSPFPFPLTTQATPHLGGAPLRRTYERYAMALRYSRWSQGAGALNARKAIHLACALRRKRIQKKNSTEKRDKEEGTTRAPTSDDWAAASAEDLVVVTPPAVVATLSSSSREEKREETPAGRVDGDTRQRTTVQGDVPENTPQWLEWPMNQQPLFPGGPPHIANLTICAGKHQLACAVEVSSDDVSRFPPTFVLEGSNRYYDTHKDERDNFRHERDQGRPNAASLRVRGFREVFCTHWEHATPRNEGMREEDRKEISIVVGERVKEGSGETFSKDGNILPPVLDPEEISAVTSAVSVAAYLHADTLDAHCGTLSIVTSVRKNLSAALLSRQSTPATQPTSPGFQRPSGLRHRENSVCASYRIAGAVCLELPLFPSSSNPFSSSYTRDIPLYYDVMPFPPPKPLRLVWDTTHQWMNPTIPSAVSSSSRLRPQPSEEKEEAEEEASWIPGDDPRQDPSGRSSSVFSLMPEPAGRRRSSDPWGETAGGDHPHTNGALLYIYLRHELGMYVDYFPVYLWSGERDSARVKEGKQREFDRNVTFLQGEDSHAFFPFQGWRKREEERTKIRLQDNGIYLLLDPELPLISSFRRLLTNAVQHDGLNVVVIADWYNARLASRLRRARKQKNAKQKARSNESSPWNSYNRKNPSTFVASSSQQDISLTLEGSCHIPSINQWLQELSISAGLPVTLQLTDAVLDGVLLHAQHGRPPINNVAFSSLTPVRRIGELKGGSAVVLKWMTHDKEGPEVDGHTVEREHHSRCRCTGANEEPSWRKNEENIFPFVAVSPVAAACSLPGAHYYHRVRDSVEDSSIFRRASLKDGIPVTERVGKIVQRKEKTKEKLEKEDAHMKGYFLHKLRQTAADVWGRLRQGWRHDRTSRFPLHGPFAVIDKEEVPQVLWRVFGILEIPFVPLTSSLSTEEDAAPLSPLSPRMTPCSCSSSAAPVSQTPFSSFGGSPSSLVSRVVLFSDSNCISASDERVRQLMVRMIFAYEDTDLHALNANDYPCRHSPASADEIHPPLDRETVEKKRAGNLYSDFMEQLEKNEMLESTSCLEVLKEMLYTTLTGNKTWLCGRTETEGEEEKSEGGDFHTDRPHRIGIHTKRELDVFSSGFPIASLYPMPVTPTEWRVPFNNRADIYKEGKRGSIPLCNTTASDANPLPFVPFIGDASVNTSHLFYPFSPVSSLHPKSVPDFTPLAQDVCSTAGDRSNNTSLEERTTRLLWQSAPYRLEVGTQLQRVVLSPAQAEQGELESQHTSVSAMKFYQQGHKSCPTKTKDNHSGWKCCYGSNESSRLDCHTNTTAGRGCKIKEASHYTSKDSPSLWRRIGEENSSFTHCQGKEAEPDQEEGGEVPVNHYGCADSRQRVQKDAVIVNRFLKRLGKPYGFS